MKDSKHEVLRVGFEPMWYSTHSEAVIPEHCVIDDETDDPEESKWCQKDRAPTRAPTILHLD